MKYHFIAIGGSVMHNLALALHQQGHTITGSDDEIYDPARTFLQQAGLLPAREGWDPERIHQELDAVIVGMHAKADNPELLKAQALGLPVYSFPAFIYAHSQSQQRIVIAGSHGKTTITSMIMHVLRHYEQDFNYLVGARLEGFDTMVRLSPTAPVIVLEGDEYLTSPLDRRPKFLHYQPHIVVLSGIAWDHINAFPTYEGYKEQFALLLRTIAKNGALIYAAEDTEVQALVRQEDPAYHCIPYRAPHYSSDADGTTVQLEQRTYQLSVFGRHNLSNAAAAQQVCAQLGITAEAFWRAMEHFKGAAKRLEPIAEGKDRALFRDFAHAPSKVKASVSAMLERYPDRPLTAVLELHTFSSLNPDFLPQYAHTLAGVEEGIIYLNPQAMAKKGRPISAQEIHDAFQRTDLLVTQDIAEVVQALQQQEWPHRNLICMSSGNLGGLSMDEIGSFVGLTEKPT